MAKGNGEVALAWSDSPHVAEALGWQGRQPECLTGTAMTGSDLPHITGTAVAEFPVPLPSHEEQREIVRRVQALLRLGAAIAERLEAAAGRTERISQAVLAKAFRGEHVAAAADKPPARQPGA